MFILKGFIVGVCSVLSAIGSDSAFTLSVASDLEKLHRKFMECLKELLATVTWSGQTIE